jgi:ribonuclease D
VQALAAWREREAQGRDLPRNRIMRDDLLLEVAANRPTTLEDMAKLRRVSLDRSMARSVVEAVGEALALPASALPKIEPPVKLPRGIGPLVELLRVLLKFKSEEHHVAQRLVATTDDLEQIAAFDAPDVAPLKGWRREVFGDAALALKRGEIGLAVRGNQVKIIATRELDAPV